MKKAKKWLFFILIIIIIFIYSYITFPHNFATENKNKKCIIISYTENILNQNSGYLKSYFLENNKEISDLLEIFNKYHYRYYIENHNKGFENATSEIRIYVYYNDGKYDVILLYSDGTLYVNTKSAHIGIWGNKQSIEMYHDIINIYKNKFI